MNLIQPSYLKKGDKIAIVAPARKISLEEIKSAIDILESWGLEVVLSKNLFKSVIKPINNELNKNTKNTVEFGYQSIKLLGLNSFIDLQCPALQRGNQSTCSVIASFLDSCFSPAFRWLRERLWHKKHLGIWALSMPVRTMRLRLSIPRA